MKEYHRYSIKQNRFNRSLLYGLEVKGVNTLTCCGDIFHRFFVCDRIDGIETGALWGRAHMEWKLDNDMLVIIHIAATDEETVEIEERQINIKDYFSNSDISLGEKLHLMEILEAKRVLNQKDTLLYELKGRYLYLMVEVCGLGEGHLTNLFVDNQRDVLSEVDPEIRQMYGSVYHRYMSVFSASYMDFQEKIKQVSNVLDIDTAPLNFLPVFAGWMGLEMGTEFFTEEVLRKLVKEAYKLNRIKGTKESILRICEIILGEKVIVIDPNSLQENMLGEEDVFGERITGEGKYDVTILIKSYLSEIQKSQLMYILNQFKPVRCRINLKYLEQTGNFDGHMYMDMNAAISDQQALLLDDSAMLDENMVIL